MPTSEALRLDSVRRASAEERDGLWTVVSGGRRTMGMYAGSVYRELRSSSIELARRLAAAGEVIRHISLICTSSEATSHIDGTQCSVDDSACIHGPSDDVAEADSCTGLCENRTS